MLLLYGITHCDSVKNARQWLSLRHIDHQFIDFKQEPPDEILLRHWLQYIDLGHLLNKRSRSWRALSATEQDQATNDSGAIALMVKHPNLIKRPVLQHPGGIMLGFNAERYAQLFSTASPNKILCAE